MQERALARQGLTGFGWRGWCAVAVLIGLLVGVWGGFDPFILVLTALARAFGAEAPVKFVVYWLIWERMAMVAPSLSLVTVVVLLPVLRIEPGPFPWGRLLVLVVAAIVLPAAAAFVPRLLPGLDQSWSFQYTASAIGLGGGVWNFPLGRLVCMSALDAMIIAWVVRSWRAGVAAFAVALALIAWDAVTVLTDSSLMNSYPTRNIALVVWYLAVLLPAVRAAWRRRLEAVRRSLGRHCPSCAYDLRQIPTDRCPECGCVVPPAASVAVVGS